MRLAIAAVALLTVGSLASEARSQQDPPPAPAPAPAPAPRNVPLVRPAFVSSAPTRAMDQFHNDERARRRAAAEEARQMPERRARAERLAALANSGHCSEAVSIARAEGDLDMATRLVEACTPANTPAN